MSDSSFGIIGAGAVGTSLATRLHGCGCRIAWVASRTVEPAHELAARVSSVVVDLSEDVLPRATSVFICVPDSAIAATAERLATRQSLSNKAVIAHTSGALGVAALDPLQRTGARVLGWHPLQTFPERYSAEAFDGCFVGVEGDDVAMQIGIEVAEIVGAKAFHLGGEDRALYHATASMASNFTVALLEAVRELTQRRAAESEWTFETFTPLIRSSVDNAMRSSSTHALSGPIKRGDAETVRLHLREIEKTSPALHRVYRELAYYTLTIARRDRFIDSSEEVAIKAILDGAEPDRLGSRE